MDFRGFGSESIVQMALHSQLTLIGHKETGPTMPLLVFVYNTWSALAPLSNLDTLLKLFNMCSLHCRANVGVYVFDFLYTWFLKLIDMYKLERP